jgi:hypothetical protein
MITADDSFLDRLRDRAAQAINPVPPWRMEWKKAARRAEVWAALTPYHNAVHGHTHLRISLLAFIGVHLR